MFCDCGDHVLCSFYTLEYVLRISSTLGPCSLLIFIWSLLLMYVPSALSLFALFLPLQEQRQELAKDACACATLFCRVIGYCVWISMLVYLFKTAFSMCWCYTRLNSVLVLCFGFNGKNVLNGCYIWDFAKCWRKIVEAYLAWL